MQVVVNYKFESVWLNSPFQNAFLSAKTKSEDIKRILHQPIFTPLLATKTLKSKRIRF